MASFAFNNNNNDFFSAFNGFDQAFNGFDQAFNGFDQAFNGFDQAFNGFGGFGQASSSSNNVNAAALHGPVQVQWEGPGLYYPHHSYIGVTYRRASTQGTSSGTAGSFINTDALGQAFTFTNSGSSRSSIALPNLQINSWPNGGHATVPSQTRQQQHDSVGPGVTFRMSQQTSNGDSFAMELSITSRGGHGRFAWQQGGAGSNSNRGSRIGQSTSTRRRGGGASGRSSGSSTNGSSGNRSRRGVRFTELHEEPPSRRRRRRRTHYYEDDYDSYEEYDSEDDDYDYDDGPPRRRRRQDHYYD